MPSKPPGCRSGAITYGATTSFVGCGHVPRRPFRRCQSRQGGSMARVRAHPLGPEEKKLCTELLGPLPREVLGRSGGSKPGIPDALTEANLGEFGQREQLAHGNRKAGERRDLSGYAAKLEDSLRLSAGLDHEMDASRLDAVRRPPGPHNHGYRGRI